MDVLGIEGVQRIGHTERLCAEQWTDESPIVSPAVINNWSDFCYKIFHFFSRALVRADDTVWETRYCFLVESRFQLGAEGDAERSLLKPTTVVSRVRSGGPE